MPNFFDKEKYVLHFEYLRLGLKLKKMHHLLEFNQSQWLKLYVEFNTEKQIEAEKKRGKVEKALYTLMTNVVYGKTRRNRIDVKLVSNKEDVLKWTSKPSFMSQKIYENHLIAVHINKVPLTLNKPAYVGICIFDLSKEFMYEFHYDYIKNKYGNNSSLLYYYSLTVIA